MKYETLFNCLNDVKELGGSVFLRPSMTIRAMLKDTRLNLLLKVSIRKMVLITKRPFLYFVKNDSFRIIMALISQYDLKLHQMDVKTAFLNENLEEEVYMDQLEGFAIKGKEHMVCKLPLKSFRKVLLVLVQLRVPDQ